MNKFDINLNLYRSFYYVAKYGGFTKASKYALISQSSLSSNIKNLENNWKKEETLINKDPLLINAMKDLEFIPKELISINISRDELSMYINPVDYVIVFIIILVLCFLIANRYGRKIFKDSIIKTYDGGRA